MEEKIKNLLSLVRQANNGTPAFFRDDLYFFAKGFREKRLKGEISGTESALLGSLLADYLFCASSISINGRIIGAYAKISNQKKKGKTGNLIGLHIILVEILRNFGATEEYKTISRCSSGALWMEKPTGEMAAYNLPCRKSLCPYCSYYSGLEGQPKSDFSQNLKERARKHYRYFSLKGKVKYYGRFVFSIPKEIQEKIRKSDKNHRKIEKIKEKIREIRKSKQKGARKQADRLREEKKKLEMETIKYSEMLKKIWVFLDSMGLPGALITGHLTGERTKTKGLHVHFHCTVPILGDEPCFDWSRGEPFLDLEAFREKWRESLGVDEVSNPQYSYDRAELENAVQIAHHCRYDHRYETGGAQTVISLYVQAKDDELWRLLELTRKNRATRGYGCFSDRKVKKWIDDHGGTPLAEKMRSVEMDVQAEIEKYEVITQERLRDEAGLPGVETGPVIVSYSQDEPEYYYRHKCGILTSWEKDDDGQYRIKETLGKIPDHMTEETKGFYQWK